MKTSTRIFAIICSLTIILSSLTFTAPAKTIAQLEAEIDKYEQQISNAAQGQANAKEKLKALQEQSRAIDQKVQALEKEMAPIREKINELTKQINEFEARIQTLEKEIKETNDKIDEQDKQIEGTRELLAKRLRAAYIAGETSELEIFLNATDFSDFLARSELLRQVSKHDDEVVKGLQEQINVLKQLKTDLDSKRAENEEKKAVLATDRAEHQAEMNVFQGKMNELEATQARNEKNIKEQNKIIATYNQNSAYYQQLLAQAEKEKAEFSAALDKEFANGGSSGNGVVDNGPVNHNFKVSSKGLILPVQGANAYYSADFASHSSRGTASVDFCDPANRVVNGKTYYTSKGAKVYAVASGTVNKSTFASSSYGHYINIDHGNGLSSLYAHLDVRYVSVGDKVVQGQVIGLIGNTGNCWPRPSAANPVAGSHLHFEMRLNGNRVNPENYLPYLRKS